jgi:putative ABC transport system permease protein
MSILVAAVGALGLAATMSVNTLERVREIGIMRSVGASSKTILEVIITEGLSIGVLSWLLGTIMAIPLTAFIARQAGQFIFPRVMQIAIPLWIPLLWLGITLVITVVASYFPARNASRLTVREVLTYE